MERAHNVQTTISRALQTIGDSTSVLSRSTVRGGCISDALCIKTEAGIYFLKTNAHNFFHAEAHGLKLLRETASVGVPNVLAVDSDFILLEWIPNHGSFNAKTFGHQLAAMHRTTAKFYGLERHNFIGANPQKNSDEVISIRALPPFVTEVQRVPLPVAVRRHQLH